MLGSFYLSLLTLAACQIRRTDDGPSVARGKKFVSEKILQNFLLIRLRVEDLYEANRYMHETSRQAGKFERGKTWEKQ